jgi:hypothetical protein
MAGGGGQVKKVIRYDKPTDTLDTSGRLYRQDKVSDTVKRILEQTPKQPTYNDYCELIRTR